MNNCRFIYWAAFVLCQTGASGQYFYYAPNTVTVPVVADKHAGILGAGLSWGSDYRAVELRGIYSPLKHGAVMVNFFQTGSKNIRRNTTTGTRFTFAEIALGAYKSLLHGSASLFGGVGQGGLYNNYGAENFSNFTLRRWFLQPALAYRDRVFRGGLALRLSRLTYLKGETVLDINDEQLVAIRKIENESPFFLPELGLSGAVSIAPCSISLHLSTVFPDVDGLNFSRVNTNLTLALDFGRMNSLRKEKNSVRR